MGHIMVNLCNRYRTHNFQHPYSFHYSFRPLINNNHSHPPTHPLPPQKVTFILFPLPLFSINTLLLPPITLYKPHHHLIIKPLSIPFLSSQHILLPSPYDGSSSGSHRLRPSAYSRISFDIHSTRHHHSITTIHSSSSPSYHSQAKLLLL